MTNSIPPVLEPGHASEGPLPIRSSVPPLLGSPAVLKVEALKGHELWADCYDSQPNPLLHREEREILSCLKDVEGKIVVDVACGTGRWTRQSLRLGASQVIGLDASPAMLRQAARRVPANTLVQADATALPVGSLSADIVLCSFAIAYLEDLNRAVFEWRRVLKPCGTLWCSDFHPDALEFGWKRTFKKNGLTYELLSHRRSAAEIRACLRQYFRTVDSQDLYLEEAETHLVSPGHAPWALPGVPHPPAVLLFCCRD
ncbi:MAG: class I SAM-dependent methyltransferase [Acidobacteriota bacterium]